MSDEIKVGDVCEIIGPMADEHCHPISLKAYIGTECTVYQGPLNRPWFATGVAFGVKTYDGLDVAIDRAHLRKKRPPQRDDLAKVQWKDCEWKPAGVAA